MRHRRHVSSALLGWEMSFWVLEIKHRCHVPLLARLSRQALDCFVA